MDFLIDEGGCKFCVHLCLITASTFFEHLFVFVQLFTWILDFCFPEILIQ